MGKYGNGISFVGMCSKEKEAIKAALAGKIRIGEDENGFTYMPGTKEQCDKVVIDAFDNMVYNAIQAMAGCNALEKCIERNKVDLTVEQYIRDVMEAGKAFASYEYDYDEISEEDY